MYRDITYVESCQLTCASGFSDLTINGMSEWHCWSVFGDLWDSAACTLICKKTCRWPEFIYFGISFYSVYAVQMIGVAKCVRKYKRSYYYQQGNMNASA